MRITKSVTMLLALATLATIGATARLQAASTPETANARSASAIVKVVADPSVIRLDCDSMFMLLQHAGIATKAARSVLGPEMAENAHDWIDISGPSENVYRMGERGARLPSAPAPQDSAREVDMLHQLQQIYAPVTRLTASADPKAKKEDKVGFRADRASDQAMTFVLAVQLPEELQPGAQEFLKAVVESLRETLLGAHRAYEGQIDRQIMETQAWWEAAEDDYLARTGARSPAQMQVREQLDAIVDLSALSPEMPLSEAFEELQESVSPPLQIAAFWRDLLDDADIEPSTPIDVGPLPHVRLGTALDVLLKAVGGEAELSYRITDSVITVGTAEALADHTRSLSRPMVEADIKALDGERRGLAHQVRTLELELAGFKARQEAIENQISIIRSQAQKRLAEDTVTQELEKLVEVSVRSLQQVERLVESGRASEVEVARLREDLARASIELARRREELSRSAGGGQIEQFNDELSRLEIDMAEKRAQSDMLRKQLEEIRQEIASAATFDPQTARLRIACEAMDAAEQRIADLKRRLMSLRQPTVTIISVD